MTQTTFQYTYPAVHCDPGYRTAIDKSLKQIAAEGTMRFPTLLARLRKEAQSEARAARRDWSPAALRLWHYTGPCGSCTPDYWYRHLGKEYSA